MADQPNAEVSDERLREIELCPFCGGEPLLISGGPGNHFVQCTVCSASSDDRDQTAAIAAWNRRSVTSQASQGADLWPNGLPEPTIDMLDLARNLPGMPSWVRAFARATAKDGSDAQRLEGVAMALEALSAAPVSKRVERLDYHEIVQRAKDAVKALDDYTSMNETEFTGWGEGAVPAGATWWRIKSGQALKALEEIRADSQALQGGRS